MSTNWVRGSVSLLAALLLGLAAVGCDDAKAEVERTLDEMNDATARRDGEAFVKLLAPESYAPYGQLAQLALDGSASQVEALSISEKVDLLMMRNRMTRKNLAALDGRGWIVHAVNNGWYELHEADEDEEALRKKQTVTVRGSTATVERYYGEWGFFSGGRTGDPVKDYMTFNKVGDRWLYDFRRPAALFEEVVKIASDELNMTTEQVLVRFEQHWSGKAVPRDIWEPMKK